jgi:hypothetical protein
MSILDLVKVTGEYVGAWLKDLTFPTVTREKKPFYFWSNNKIGISGNHYQEGVITFCV